MEALEQLTLFTEASLNLAKTCQSQASKRDCPVSAPASGTRCSELLVSLDPLTSLLRMCVERAISPCQPSSPVWKEKATKCGQASFQLLHLERRTSEKDCSSLESGKMCIDKIQKLWRTPDANCDRGASSVERMKWKQETGMPISLNDQVAHCGPLLPKIQRQKEQRDMHRGDYS